MKSTNTVIVFYTKLKFFHSFRHPYSISLFLWYSHTQKCHKKYLGIKEILFPLIVNEYGDKRVF